MMLAFFLVERVLSGAEVAFPFPFTLRFDFEVDFEVWLSSSGSGGPLLGVDFRVWV